ncbi:MAG: glycoside hydrolase family 3 C-terminal domain-containing protein [Clostridiales bacterium]|nr:glycoside hydrolase family 3 C-terminal domain-containing protein [Clostridiales bacterium]
MDIEKLIKEMTLEEKAGLCSGADFWHTKSVERLGIPAFMVSDGPHGLRKQDLTDNTMGFNDSIKAVCFPCGCATASSFNRKMMYQLGDILGNECQAEDVSVILGPAVNIKRSPLCGRNFEYYSEDPYLAGEMAANQIKGVQSHHVGTSIKHFFANNQEYRRMSSSSNMDERTAREMYMPAFENAVKNAKPWTVMCSYNRINGVYAAENKKYLTDVLRKEWGFDGFVVSDWGAINSRVRDLVAGCDLEMPASNGRNDAKIVAAVQNGELPMEVLDEAVRRILTVLNEYEQNRDKTAKFDRDADHERARKMAEECIVLLKNEDILPLNHDESIAFIGKFAKVPRFQGGGSSHINASKVESAYDYCADDNIKYADGYELTDDEIHEDLIEEAVNIAKSVDKAVLFVGLPDSYESEGFDRSHMGLPESHNELIRAVAGVNSNTVVVLHNGSPVEMPWIEEVKGVVETYLGGQAVGGATAKVLFGEVNPSGHLSETFPVKLEDNPSYLYYLGEGDQTEYREGVFVGYRYYDTKKMEVRFPFGHGLSYTTFTYSNLKIQRHGDLKHNLHTVSVDIKNTGLVAGKAVPQVYVAPPKGDAIRPIHELKGFEKVELAPGETKTVTFELDARSFAYYDMDIHNWYVEPGVYTIEVGESSRDIRCTCTVKPHYDYPKKIRITENTIVSDLLKIPEANKIIEEVLKAQDENLNGSADADCMGTSTADMMMAMLSYSPLRNFIGNTYDMGMEDYAKKLEALIEE